MVRCYTPLPSQYSHCDFNQYTTCWLHQTNIFLCHYLRFITLIRQNKRGSVRNIEACSCNHCCSGKSNKYYIFWVCVCSLRYPTCNVHMPYCHLWSARLYDNFPHYLIKGALFSKTLLNITCVLRLSLQLLSEPFFILRRTERDIIENVYLSSCKVR